MNYICMYMILNCTEYLKLYKIIGTDIKQIWPPCNVTTNYELYN